MFLEVIATNLNDISKINKTKAKSIELCANMDQGGYTPDYEIIKACTELSKIPVKVMVRRSNNGFDISNEEFQQLLLDIEFIKTTKAAGIVCGILTKDQKIDLARMKTIVQVAKPLKVSFHRAFDEIEKHDEALKQLTALGVDTVLTSGGKKPLLENLGHIKRLANLNLPIRILLGAGINFNNINILIKQGLTTLHVGKCVRKDESFEKPIAVELIDKLFDNFANQ